MAELRDGYLAPIDAATDAAIEAEAALETARRQQHRATAEVWERYKPDYERYLVDGDAAGRPDDVRPAYDNDLRDLLPAAPVRDDQEAP